MSLSSLLISAGGQKPIDTELDALFTAKPTASASSKPVTTPIPIPGSSKGSAKKRKVAPDVVALEEPSKRSKPSPSKAGSKQRDQAQKTSSTPKGSKAPNPGKETKKSKKASRKGKAKEVESESEDGNSDLEQAYHKAHVQEAESDEEDTDDADTPLVHESVKKRKKTSRSGSKVKFVPADETPERRDQRTIFIGNLSVDVAQKRPLLKQLQRHILSQVPTAKIESTRFRSVPFQAPTSRLPDDNTVLEGGKPTPKASITTSITKATSPAKAARAHDLDRTSAWRSRNDAVDDADAQNLKKDEKSYLTPNQKKKIAFINQEFHSTADTVNAYLVFAHPVPAENRPANLPPPPVVMDPYEAARMAVRECDGSLFMGRVIRVDLVGKKHALERAGSGVELDLDLDLVDADPKSSVFVGNLDFASKEEDLRVFFEGVVSAERGPPPPASEEGAGGAVGIKKPRTWVTRVRIVRDKDTQLGKGFAYVQFADRQCVDEVLALEPTKLKFAKRKLRVQRCRTLPGSSTSTRQATASASTKEKDANKKPKGAPVPIVVPRGDPKLGERLAHLPKEARKQYKSADADRVARRLAKKKARMAMASKGGVEVKGRERERVRKTKVGATGAGKKKARVGGKKGRVRSEKSLAKMNGKKAAGAADR